MQQNACVTGLVETECLKFPQPLNTFSNNIYFFKFKHIMLDYLSQATKTYAIKNYYV